VRRSGNSQCQASRQVSRRTIEIAVTAAVADQDWACRDPTILEKQIC
jgi:hypothetical protein